MIGTIFTLLLVYQLKHFAIDYPGQSPDFFIGKFKVGLASLPALLVHAGLHGMATFWIAFIATGHGGLALYLGTFDMVAHASMDKIKASPNLLGRWKPLTGLDWMEYSRVARGGISNLSSINPDAEYAKRKLLGNKLFWVALGFDQGFHHLTHYACIWAILGFPR